tara:strand:+ start:2412 stop:2888 length:477 start_codon:yes stop_codon:yes gene_type:complete
MQVEEKKQPKKEKQVLKVKKSKRVIKHIVVHCSATKEGMDFSAKDIDKWHKNRGWSGIGYNWVVRNDARGTIETGRDIDRIPAHVKGINRNSLGICYIGGLDQNGDPKDTRTDIQKHQLRSLLKDLRKIYPEARISGHNEWSSKACPCFDCKIEYSQI